MTDDEWSFSLPSAPTPDDEGLEQSVDAGLRRALDPRPEELRRLVDGAMRTRPAMARGRRLLVAAGVLALAAGAVLVGPHGRGPRPQPSTRQATSPLDVLTISSASGRVIVRSPGGSTLVVLPSGGGS